MRRLGIAGLAVALTAVTAAEQAAAGSEASASVSCGATAKQLVKRTGVWRSTPKDFRRFVEPVDPICRDFTRDGRRDVAFPILSGGTGGAFKFAVFRGTSDGFVKMTERGFGSKTSLRRRGRRLLVLNPIYREGDANCCPSGGTRVRTFRFTRTKLVLIGEHADRAVTRRGHLVAVLAGAGIALGACGGDEAPETGATDTGAATQPEPAPDTGPAEAQPQPTGPEDEPQAPQGEGEARPAPRPSPEDQPGGAGDEIPASSQALLTGTSGRVTPSLVRVPPFIAVRVVLRSADGARYSLTGAGKRVSAGGRISSTSATFDGLRPGKRLVLKGTGGRVTIEASAEPGP